jgi:hypothetical protein
MHTAVWIGATLAVSAFLVSPVRAEPQMVELAVVDRDPPAGSDLGLGSPLSVRVHYKSAVPVRFRLEGRLHGKAVAASMLNPAPLYPAGEGEAIAWIAYRQPGSIDEVVVRALDDAWKPLASLSMPVLIGWSGDIPHRHRAQWVVELNGVQQDMASRAMKAHKNDDGGILFSLFPVAVLAYFALQPWTIKRFESGWRMAAFLPLIGTVPLGLYTIIAFAAGSNLWPLLLILCTPFATLYLLGLAAVRAIVRAS